LCVGQLRRWVRQQRLQLRGRRPVASGPLSSWPATITRRVAYRRWPIGRRTSYGASSTSSDWPGHNWSAWQPARRKFSTSPPWPVPSGSGRTWTGTCGSLATTGSSLSGEGCGTGPPTPAASGTRISSTGRRCRSCYGAPSTTCSICRATGPTCWPSSSPQSLSCTFCGGCACATRLDLGSPHRQWHCSGSWVQAPKTSAGLSKLVSWVRWPSAWGQSCWWPGPTLAHHERSSP